MLVGRLHVMDGGVWDGKDKNRSDGICRLFKWSYRNYIIKADGLL